MPIIHIAGLPVDADTGGLIRQLNQTPAPTDPYVRGIRVGPLGGVYMIGGSGDPPPNVLVPPTLIGTPTVGVPTSYTQAVVEGGALAAIQWLLDGVPIPGATAATYTPVSGDVGKDLSVRETWTNAAGSVDTTSNGGAVNGFAPAVVSSPELTMVLVGAPVVYTTGVVNGAPTPTISSRQWYLSGVALPGAAGASYTPELIDQRGMLSLKEVWTNSFGSVETISPPVQVAQAPTVLIALTVAGIPITTVPSGLNRPVLHGYPVPTLTSTQWTIDGADIPLATGPTYAPIVADNGKLLGARQVWSNVHGSVTTTAPGVVVAVLASERWVHPGVGSDASPGTEALPWAKIPGQAGANVLTSRHIVNVRNGSVSTDGPITPTNNNMIYRGYGLAANILQLTQPDPSNPENTIVVPVVREAGVHEGMWILDGTGWDAHLFNINNAIFGCAVMDAHIKGDQTQPTDRAGINVGIGTADNAQTGLVIERCFVETAAGDGVRLRKKNNTIKYLKVEYSRKGSILVTCNNANGHQAGGTDSYEYLDLAYPSWIKSTDSYSGELADIYQVNVEQLDPRVEFSCSVFSFYCYKRSTTKEILVTHDWLNHFCLDLFHVAGATNGGLFHLHTRLRGQYIMRNGYNAPYTGNLPWLRYSPNEQITEPVAMTVNGKVIVDSVHCAGNPQGLYKYFETVDAALFSGQILFIQTSITGTVNSNNGYGVIVADPQDNTLDSTFRFRVLNNDLSAATGSAPAFLMGSTQRNNNACMFAGNNVGVTETFEIGGTNYATLGEFEAAHTGARENETGTPVPPEVTAPSLSIFPTANVPCGYASGTAPPGYTSSVQWVLNGADVVGQTGPTYTPTTGNINGFLAIRQTWTNDTESVSAVAPQRRVLPQMATAVAHKYIDSTLGADDGGPFAEGAAYTPSFPLADGSVAPEGTIYSTCALAYAAASGNNQRYYCRKGYFHDPAGGVFFTTLFIRLNTLFSSYGPSDAGNPILDGVVYLTGSAGWTPHGSIANAWNYNLTGVTEGNSTISMRMWVGRRKDGNLLSQRPVGTGRRRATSLANLSLTNTGVGSGLWYVTAGSPSVLTVLSQDGTAPPISWDGIGIVCQALSAGTARGVNFRQPASGNRVESIGVQGCTNRQFSIGDLNADGVCDKNAFVDTDVLSTIGSAYYIVGTSATQNITNTYLSAARIDMQASNLESDDTSQFMNANGYSIGGYTNSTRCDALVGVAGNIHSMIDMRGVGNAKADLVRINGYTATFIPGTTYGRGIDGFGYDVVIENFTINAQATRSQLAGQNVIIRAGVVNGMQQNFDPNDSKNCFSFGTTAYPSGVVTSNYLVEDVEFFLAGSPPKSPIWFQSNGTTPVNGVNAVEIRNIKAHIDDTQGLVTNATTSAGVSNPWPSQNIHDNVLVNANLIGNNYSTTNSSNDPPTFTAQPLNGYMGTVNNTVVPT